MSATGTTLLNLCWCACLPEALCQGEFGSRVTLLDNHAGHGSQGPALQARPLCCASCCTDLQIIACAFDCSVLGMHTSEREWTANNHHSKLQLLLADLAISGPYPTAVNMHFDCFGRLLINCGQVSLSLNAVCC